ncbi:hypothetical protein JL100_017770 [Skermanella mucosa]|uniref:hypothetical protein n=1 Tax=Skermanella mucosa TaxID=1789672 RepID=UPI00192CB863|nr:hypothetical protein [Skermanella mucosa]UEM18938.1 hypothetical protein JL100_017770 [Skermanella mucosa]
MTMNGLPNSGEPDGRRPGRVIMGTAKIIDFQQAVAARAPHAAGRPAPHVEDMDAFRGEIGTLQHQLDLLSVHLGLMLWRFDLILFSIQETAGFCADCREAMEMTDIDAMERARDDLKAKLDERAAFWRNP